MKELKNGTAPDHEQFTVKDAGWKRQKRKLLEICNLERRRIPAIMAHETNNNSVQKII